MMILERFVKKIKGDDFSLDKNISFGYLFNKSIEMIINLIRGNIKFAFAKKSSFIIFIGKKTKIKMPSKIRVGKGVNIGEYVVIDALSRDNIYLGDNVRIGDYTRILCTGTIKHIGKGFSIGNNCGIGEFCFFGAAGGIEIGNDVIMGQNVRFHSENHKYEDINLPIRLQGVTNKGIKVGDNCWIGSGVVVLDGITIGSGCVIGANTIVNKDIPNDCVVVGNPARVVKKRSNDGSENEKNIIC